MSDTLMNTREIAEYLGIHEKQVYALIKANKIPCTKVTGKWLFQKELIDAWIIENSQNSESSSERKKYPGNVLLASGSNDPVLDILLNVMKQKNPEFYIFTSSSGSIEGLKLLKNGVTSIAWCHLYDPDTGAYNIPYLAQYFTDKKIAVVHLFYRELGFLSSKNSPVMVKRFEDLSSPGLKFINRQKGSGTRLILDYNLDKINISADSIKGYEIEVFTHLEVGLALSAGEAHAGIATVAISKLFDLGFQPIIKESFDMVLTQKTFFNSGIQSFIESLGSKEFRQLVTRLGSYDFTESGKIIHSIN